MGVRGLQGIAGRGRGVAVKTALWRRLWNGWKHVAEKIGAFQSRVLLTVLYFTVVAPFALIARMGRDALRVRRVSGSAWVERLPRPTTLETFRRQY